MKYLPIFILLSVNIHMTEAQNFATNYDEAKVPAYTLNDILRTVSGQKITNTAQWNANRPALLGLFAKEMYGVNPKLMLNTHIEVVQQSSDALDGLAAQKQISIIFDDYPELSPINILLYIPKKTKNPPVFLGLNFEGNHSLTADTSVFITKNWINDFQQNPTIVNQNYATAASRNSAKVEVWPFKKIVEAGFAVATVFHGDIEPDSPQGWKSSIRKTLSENQRNAWSTLGVWAWGLSKVVDFLQTETQIDKNKILLIGHSRMGKAAVWAAAQDTRIAALISNESGEGGVALSKREFGETIEAINVRFPHWFCENFKKYNNNSAALPFDQHQLLGLMAPRPVYVSSAEGDQWSDPTGEFLALKYANPVYKLFKKPLLTQEKRPAVNVPIGIYNRYHYRTGKHYLNEYDWDQYLAFAKNL